MAGRIVAATFRTQPELGRLVWQDARKLAYVIAEETLLLNTISIQQLHNLLTKHKFGADGKIRVEEFTEILEDIYDRARPQNQQAIIAKHSKELYDRLVRKLFKTLDTHETGVLSPLDLCMGLSIFCRSEARGGSGIEDESVDAIEDLLFILRPTGTMKQAHLSEYLTHVFALLFTMSSTLSEIAAKNKNETPAQMANRVAYDIMTTIAEVRHDESDKVEIPVRHFISWIRNFSVPSPYSKRDWDIAYERHLGHRRQAPFATSHDVTRQGPRRRHLSTISLTEWLGGADDALLLPSSTPISPSTIASTPYALDEGQDKNERVKLKFDHYYPHTYRDKLHESDVTLGEIREESSPNKSRRAENEKGGEPEMIEIKLLRERIYAIIRDFCKGAITTSVLRSRIEALGIRIPPSAERLLRLSAGSGGGTFVEFVKAFDDVVIPGNVYVEADKRITAPPLTGAKDPPKPPFTSDKRSNGDVVSWRSPTTMSKRELADLASGMSRQNDAHKNNYSRNQDLLRWPEMSKDERHNRSPGTRKLTKPWAKDANAYWKWQKGVSSRSVNRSDCPFGTEKDVGVAFEVKTGRKHNYPAHSPPEGRKGRRRFPGRTARETMAKAQGAYRPGKGGRYVRVDHMMRSPGSAEGEAFRGTGIAVRNDHVKSHLSGAGAL